ncbi:6-phosphofructokinase [Candidatus Hepatincolaceae symbiont of Richtersius coronifer]
MSEIKRIGVLTSGGDCSGLNAAIRAGVLRAHQLGWEVYGIIEGTVGLMQRPLNYIKLTPENVGVELLRMGGTILRTVNKGDPFNFPMPDGTFKDRSLEIVEGYKQLGIDALIAIGGDGSMRIIEKLTALGNIRFIGIPKTIDNDVPFTEFPIGYMTAVSCAVENIERLHDTALSHKRVMVAEVMGRDVGHIALSSGIASGADVILIPEIPYDINKVADKIKEIYKNGRDYAIIVCSEAAISKSGSQTFSEGQDNKKYGGVGYVIGNAIEKITEYETRVTVLGHTQRGGTPVALDRIIATAFGVKAVDLLNEGQNRRVVGWMNRRVIDVDLNEIINTSGAVDIEGDLVKTAKGVGISFGE